MLIFMKKIILALIICFVFITRVNAENEKISSDVINLKSQSGIIIEADTGKVLFEKDADTKRPPASMTKIMTMLLIVEELEKGNILLKDEVKEFGPVTSNPIGLFTTKILSSS